MELVTLEQWISLLEEVSVAGGIDDSPAHMISPSTHTLLERGATEAIGSGHGRKQVQNVHIVHSRVLDRIAAWLVVAQQNSGVIVVKLRTFGRRRVELLRREATAAHP